MLVEGHGWEVQRVDTADDTWRTDCGSDGMVCGGEFKVSNYCAGIFMPCPFLSTG